MRWAPLFLLLTLPGLWAQETSFFLTSDVGFFNKAYQDRQYVSTTMVTLAVPYWALSAEVRHQDQGNILGATVAQTTIGSGTKFNYDQWESQPLTILTFAGFFVGKDFGWWEADLGVGALVQLKDFESVAYRAADGTLLPGRTGGLDWDHRESFTLVTGLFRLLPLSGPHVKLRIAREGLSLTEDLFNVEGVLPGTSGNWSIDASFSSPLGYWTSSSGILRNNPRLELGWLSAGPLRFGIRGGFLLQSVVAGTGDVDLLHRLSLGLDLAINLPPSR